MRDMLHDHGFAGFWAGHDQAALTLAYWGEYIEYPAGGVLFAFYVAFENHGLVGMQRRQVFEHHAMLDGLGLLAVDLVHLDQGEIPFAVFGRAHLDRKSTRLNSSH